MKKGEIWLVEFPQSMTHEQAGYRPALLLATTANVGIFIPFSSNLQTLTKPYVLEIIPSNKNKLKNFSAALVFQIRAIDKIRIKYRIGELESGFIKEIDRMLRKLLVL